MTHVTILDTNILSELMRPSPSRRVVAWASGQRTAAGLCITTITVAEVLFGIELLAKGKRHGGLLAEVEAMFADDFVGRILPFDEAAARAFPPIAAERRLRGKPTALFDAQIAAIAQAHGATLATRNTSDFAGCGIKLVNPWLD